MPACLSAIPVGGDEHRVGLSIPTDRRDVVVACPLLPIGRKCDPDNGLAILTNDSLAARLCRRTCWGGVAKDVRRCFAEVRVRGILVCRGGLVLGTRLRFPVMAGAVAPVTTPTLAPVSAPSLTPTIPPTTAPRIHR